MRVLLVCHAFASEERTGVELHTEALARALVRRGVQVHLVAPSRREGDFPLAQRRSGCDGFEWTEIVVDPICVFPPEEGPPGMARAFGNLIERERPQLVHFQHLQGLGLGLLKVAREAGLPTIYNAQDAFPLGPNPTLLQPDLSPQSDLGPQGYGSVAAARAFLDRIPRLGDHHGFVLVDQLEPCEREQLAQCQSSGDANWTEQRLSAWRGSFGRVDRMFATSNSLARGLSTGLELPVHVRPAGIELDALSRVARDSPVDPERERLRLGYFGALLKPKGVHWLLDAWEGMQERFDLQVHGGSKDYAYRGFLERRALEVGARMCGGYGPQELPERLAGVDLVIVPSLWQENAPFVLREAFAAGRPVIAARTPALEESVRDGVDGRLFEQGVAADLRACLTDLDRNRAAVGSLRDGIALVQDIDHEATGWVETYRELFSLGPQASVDVGLPHLEGFARRYHELSCLPTAELSSRACEGWSRLCEVLGVAARHQEWLREALAGGLAARDRHEDGERRVEWLDEKLASGARTLTAERERGAWLEEQLADGQAHLELRAREIEGIREALNELERERDWLLAQCAERQRELEWRREVAQHKELELAELVRAREDGESALESGRREVEWLRRTLREVEVELDWLRTSLERCEAERSWRAEQMAKARREAKRWNQRLAGGALGRRARGWAGPRTSDQEPK